LHEILIFFLKEKRVFLKKDRNMPKIQQSATPISAKNPTKWQKLQQNGSFIGLT
jgi:hypothetical protein